MAQGVLALSGTLLVFKPEWLKATVPGASSAVALDATALGQAATAAEQAFGPDAIRSMVFASPQFGLHQVNLADGGAAYIDPRTLEVVQRWPKNGRFVDWLFDLHHYLLSGEVGAAVAGWIGVAALVMTITGLILWWPSRRSFAWRWRPRGGSRRELLGAHRDIGVLTAPVVVILLTTGAGVALHQQSRPLMDRLFGPGPAFVAPKAATSGPIDWPAAITNAAAVWPDATPRVAIWPASPQAPV